MIDKEILDSVLPVPELEELKESTVKELEEEGFVITNFHSGGVFYTLLMIVLRIKIEFTELLRKVLSNMSVTHASGAWLDLKVADYGKKRKKAQKTRGLVTLSRASLQGEAVKIPKGHVFKTLKDINGEELRFFVLEAAVLQKGVQSVDVLVEAEKEGARYNVPTGQIVHSLTYLNGVETVNNGADWIVREGSDTEDDEGVRARTLRSWSERAKRPIEDTFINAATEGLIAEVKEAVGSIAGPYDNVSVRGSTTIEQDITLAVTVTDTATDEEVTNRVKAVLGELLAVRKGRKLYELRLSDINHAVRTGCSGSTNVTISVPAADVKLEKDKVITLGAVSVTVGRE